MNDPECVGGVGQTPDIPHRGSIVRFCDSDTIALEKAYRCVANGTGRVSVD